MPLEISGPVAGRSWNVISVYGRAGTIIDAAVEQSKAGRHGLRCLYRQLHAAGLGIEAENSFLGETPDVAIWSHCNTVIGETIQLNGKGVVYLAGSNVKHKKRAVTGGERLSSDILGAANRDPHNFSTG